MGIKNLSLWQKLSLFDKKTLTLFIHYENCLVFTIDRCLCSKNSQETSIESPLFKKTVFKDENIGIYLVQTFTGYNRASYVLQKSSFTL